jgi:flagella basal body P-ring formation protein FlgA
MFSKVVWGSLLGFLCLFAFAVAGQAATPTSILLPEQEVREAVNRFLMEKLEGRGWEIAIRQLSIPKGVKITSGPRELELVAPSGWNGWGAVSVALVVRVNGVIEKNIPLRLQVDARTDMVTATRQLLAGTVLTLDDLRLQKQDLVQSGGYPVKSLEDVVGKKLRTTVREGTPIRSNQLVSVPVIVSGQLVTIVAENTGIRITVSGRAKSAGGVGDLIRVQNMLSNKEIPARIVDASTVQVGF